MSTHGNQGEIRVNNDKEMSSVKREKRPLVKVEPSDSQPVAGGHSPAVKREPVADSDPFADDSPAKGPSAEDAKPEKTSYLSQLMGLASPEILELGVDAGVQLLERLKRPLQAAAPLGTTEAPHWLKAIQDLQPLAQPTRTIVGVVGNTGAGKSSIINALLDEERLLPTNCLRACTASPTEISFNHSNDLAEAYRAEIEFITTEDWTKELDALFRDMLDAGGEISRECTNADSDSGVAYAKVKAVYPNKTKEMIAKSNSKDLVNEPRVRGVLGTVKKLRESSAEALYRGLQYFVDSKEKNKEKEKEMEYWPLIKVVRIFTKAKALSTGVIMVDLPGVQDSNAARAAVAQSYMKTCSGLWIVAPTTRAVDDKTAKTLLGNSFRRQMKYDGNYSAVTFICSKTDDISVTEAVESLGLEEQVAESWSKVDEIKEKQRELKERLGQLKDEKAALMDLLEECDSKVDAWDDLADSLRDGQTVYAPAERSNRKRKRQSKPARSRKNRISIDSPDEDDESDSEYLSSGSKENNQQSNTDNNNDRKPLTEDQIMEELSQLKAERKAIRENKKRIDQGYSENRDKTSTLESEKEALVSQIKSVCIKGRNEYSRNAIKRDFAMGIKEIDQENANAEDERAFDPDQNLRDYDEVARSLPVFCVSSRAFQKLNGRLRKDNFAHQGFESVKDTGIPQLQEHAKNLTENPRVANCRRFLNPLLQLLNSMKMWASNGDTRESQSDDERRSWETHLVHELSQLEKRFDNAVEDCIASIKERLTEDIYNRFDQYNPAAVNAAVPTATGWGDSRAAGGMFWVTYKATTRRSGVFCGAAGPRDFNAELFEPVSRHLASGWERAMQRHLPTALNQFSTNATKLLRGFHHIAVALGPRRPGIAMLNHQLPTHVQSISQLRTEAGAMVTDLQRDASRAFTPEIQRLMEPVYTACSDEWGPGSFMRMKGLMVSHVESTRVSMFDSATNVVKSLLQQMCDAVRDLMASKTEENFQRISRDYLAVLVGANATGMSRAHRAERLLCSEMEALLAGSDAVFKDVVAY